MAVCEQLQMQEAYLYKGYPESKDTTRVGGEGKSPQTIPLTDLTSLPAISICFCI
jgi:hypothetical protein